MSSASRRFTLLLLLLPAPLFGQVVRPPASRDTNPAYERREAVERGLRGPVTLRGGRGMLIGERMAFHNVPGLSIAVVNEGRVEWARGYGVREAGKSDSVTTETLFQAASLSKPVTALAALRLVREGLLVLDGEVNPRLTSWQIPENEFTRTRKVTLRDLLTHGSGLTNSIGAYAPDTPALPTHIEALDGLSSLKPRPVRVEFEPGSKFEYSGGGFSVLQLLLEDITRRRFVDLMDSLVLAPLEMRHSHFDQPLPPALERLAASGHGPDGQPFPGRWRVLPEAAAGGLWSTPSDLARFVIELQEAHAGRSSRIVDSSLVRPMLSPQLQEWGLGISIVGQGVSRYFMHTGWNRGYRSLLVGFVETGHGVIVMTNGNSQGIDLISEIVRAVAEVYGWPALRGKERAAVAPAPDRHPEFIGRYRMESGPEFRVATEGQRLLISGGPFGARGVELHRESRDTYFPLVTDVTLIFQRNAQGVVTELVVRPPGADTPRIAARTADRP